jgi:hypothetical protein
VTPIKLWLGSSIVSLGLACAIGFLWHKAFIELNIPLENELEKNLIDHAQIIKQFNAVNKSKQLEITSLKDYIFVPTGIYIQDLNINIDQVSCIGYVWQKYPVQAFDSIKPGIIFPQSMGNNIKKIYEFTDDIWHTIGWSVQCTLDQNFNFDNYPFDAQKIEIQLWPSDFDSAIILVPDLDSYKSFNLDRLFGLNNTIKLQDWHLEESYFSYEKENFKTNFGYTTKTTQRSLPQLKFNVIVNRSLYGSFILNIVSILIVLILLFIVLLMVQWAGFYSVLASIASLFFIALFAYSSFRSAFKSQQIVFFDYVYFILESIILIISILSIIYYKNVPITWITYNHMSIPRLIFWPITMLSICIVSIIFFF